jgi:TolB-like protein
MGDGVNIAARIEGIAKPGAICLSEQAYWQVKGRLDLGVTDLGPIRLKNIADPIRVYSLDVGAPVDMKPTPAPAHQTSAAPRLSMVVLPFANIGGDPSHEHFVDGVTESLTTDLSRIRGAVVIGRNTAFTYKGKAVDLKQIGGELNVRYILEGSVQHGGNRMRVNVQLIDAETGNHLWAERFDKPLADLFDMQDEIVGRLANALNAQLAAAEARRAEQAPNPDSMDLYFQGLAWFNKGVTSDNLVRARSFFDRAHTSDPSNVDALIGLGRTDALEGASFFVTDPVAAFLAAEAKLTKALSSVPDHARGHMFLGYVHICTNRAAEGIVECGSKSRQRSFHHRIWQDFHRSGRRNRGSHLRGHAPQSPRYVGLCLDGQSGVGEAPPRQLGTGNCVVSAVDRGQSKRSTSVSSASRCSGGAWSTGRGASSGQGGSCAQFVH